MSDEKIKTETAYVDDISELTHAMKRAFDDDSMKHLGKPTGGPEGYDNGDFFRKWMPYKESAAYKILYRDVVVGGVIVWVYERGRNTLGTIFVDPSYQDKGIGSSAWRYIESLYPEALSWDLGTPCWALKNHHFYEKNGFRKIREEKVDDPSIGISYIFRKKM